MTAANPEGPVLITSAVPGETENLVSEIRDAVTSSPGGRWLTRGVLYGQDAAVLITGPGMVNTAQALTAVIEHLRPSLIIHSGCAGIFEQSGGTVGDIAIAESEMDIHSGIEDDSSCSIVPAPLPFDLLETEKGPVKNRYPMDSLLKKAAFAVLSESFRDSGTRILKGPFITVATITATDDRAERLYSACEPVMESMEGSAAAHVALHYRIPFLEVRSASNRVGRRDTGSWNLPLSFRNNAIALLYLIKHINRLR